MECTFTANTVLTVHNILTSFDCIYLTGKATIYFTDLDFTHKTGDYFPH